MRAAILTMMTLAAVGCGQAETLPLVDLDGDLAGTFDPATGELLVTGDGAAVENEDGDQAAVSDGLATVDWALAPGDELLLVDGTGEVIDWLTVEEPDPASDAETRFPGCYPTIH